MPTGRLRWAEPGTEAELILEWVPGTEGQPYGFGHVPNRLAVDLPGFFMATTPVTQALWQRVMGENPAVRRGPRLPVENVSWNHVRAPGGFLDRLNASEILASVAGDQPGLRFRLPSETEWEYAARGGPHWRADLAFSGSNDPDAVAWYGPRWRRHHQPTWTHPVAGKAPNQLGLYDMSGNVWEWCEDVCIDDLAAVPADGRPYGGSRNERRLRGGCHHNWDLHCTVWWRYGLEADAHDGCIGLRVILAPERSATA